MSDPTPTPTPAPNQPQTPAQNPAPHPAPHGDMLAKAERHAAAVEAWMAPLFAKAPHLPANVKQSLVDAAPWLALLGGVLGLLAIFSLNAFTSMLLTFSFIRGVFPLLLTVGMIVGLLGAVLDLLAYKPLSERKKTGWNYLFYGMLLSVVSALFSMVSGYGGLGQIIGMVIGFWLLFEIRDAYKTA